MGKKGKGTGSFGEDGHGKTKLMGALEAAA
jgi:hypothetical protein